MTMNVSMFDASGIGRGGASVGAIVRAAMSLPCRLAGALPFVGEMTERLVWLARGDASSLAPQVGALAGAEAQDGAGHVIT
jgi:hypothetical protein